MTYNKNYYDSRKEEIQKDYQTLLIDTYAEIERLVIKKLNKTQELTEKLKVLENQEKESLTVQTEEKDKIELKDEKQTSKTKSKALK